MKTIAIVGSGISGTASAWALRNVADVELLEAAPRFGGHTRTVDIDYDGTPLAVDVGFIVYNTLNYPNLVALFETLGVDTTDSDMSFAVSDPDRYEWSSDPKGIFAWKRNLFRPGFISLLLDILRFNKTAQRDALNPSGLTRMTLGEYLENGGFSKGFRDNYILPMAGAIWSSAEDDMLAYPVESFLSFFNNHRLLHAERPVWRTVTGGSRNYLTQLLKDLGGRARNDMAVSSVRRRAGQVELIINGTPRRFDHVILACHADDSRRILGQGFEKQSEALRGIKTVANTGYLHRDESLMPKRKSAWASWNVMRTPSRSLTLTYWMNRLQHLPADMPVFVTLNPETPPPADLTFNKFSYRHPVFDFEAADGVAELKRLNGEDGLSFAGAWMGSGFHEDGLRSAIEASVPFGGEFPWLGTSQRPLPVGGDPSTIIVSDPEQPSL